MEQPRILAPWLRRGIEAGVFGALLSYATLIAYHFSLSPRFLLPQGIDGAMIVLPGLLSLTVLVIGYATFFAATRSDAWLGSITGFLIAGDLLMVTSLILGDTVFVRSIQRSIPIGVVAAAWAVPVAILGLGFGQMTTPLGFGRSAAFRSAGAALVLSIIVALAAARFTSA